MTEEELLAKFKEQDKAGDVAVKQAAEKLFAAGQEAALQWLHTKANDWWEIRRRIYHHYNQLTFNGDGIIAANAPHDFRRGFNAKVASVYQAVQNDA